MGCEYAKPGELVPVTANPMAIRRQLPDAGTPHRRLSAHGIFAHRAGLDRPPADEDGAGRGRRRRHRGFVKQFQGQPDPSRLISFGLSLNQVIAAIEANNVSRGANYIEQNGESYVVRTSGRVENAEDISQIVVAARAGVPVRIKDVAEVTIGKELRTGSASVNGREVVLGTALMLIGGNSRTVAAAADAKIKEISRTLPPSIYAHTVLNRTQLVDATIKTVATNLAEGALLVILVLFLLLGNLRAAGVTACVIPVTILVTQPACRGRTAPISSQGADFGLIVNGAVIIAENSLRHLARGVNESSAAPCPLTSGSGPLPSYK